MATARDRYLRKSYSEPLDKVIQAAAAADMAEAFEEPDWAAENDGTTQKEVDSDSRRLLH